MWLSEYCEVSPRSAQGYMRLARHREAVEANTQGLAHLGVERALKLLAPPKADQAELDEAIAADGDPDELLAIMDRMYDGPFVATDLHEDLDWQRGKLLRKCPDIPSSIALFLNAISEAIMRTSTRSLRWSSKPPLIENIAHHHRAWPSLPKCGT